MGRHTHRQRSELPANREHRRAISARRPESFGIRRFVEEGQNDALQDLWYEMQNSGVLPDIMEPRENTGVTLLPRRVLGRQMTQGLVMAYKLGGAQVKIANDHELVTTKIALPVDVVKFGVAKRRSPYIEVKSDVLETERERLFSILGECGLKGAHKTLAKPLHITLGEAPSVLSWSTEKEIIATLEEKLWDLETVDLMGWDTYPSQEEVQRTKQRQEIRAIPDCL